MPTIDITNEEQTEIINALDQSIKSSKRAQNSGKTPQIKEVYAQHERYVTALMHKIAAVPSDRKK